MNIHPILVHFPIALLALYVVFECIRFRQLNAAPAWFYLKATFLFLGGLGALAAAVTGDFGKRLYPAARAIIRTHESFAYITIAIFGILALIYMGTFIDSLWGNRLRASSYASAWDSIMNIEKKLFDARILIPLAVIGLCALMVTGALGGSVVYGVNSDPFTVLVNNFFVH